MSIDTNAATRSSGSDSDLSSYSNWSVLDDSDNNSHYAQKLRLGGKKDITRSKTKVKPPKANKKFDIQEELFIMDDILSRSSSESSLDVLEDDSAETKEDSSESFEEILPEFGSVCKKDSIEVHFKRRNKDHLAGSRSRNMSIMNILALLLLMTSFSWITAMFGAKFLSKTEMVVANEDVLGKLSNELHNNVLTGVNVSSDKDLPFKIADEPMVVILPPEDIVDANLTKVTASEAIKPHFHNDGKLTFGPVTYKDYLIKQKNKLEEMKTASTGMKDNSESLSKTISDILKSSKSNCDSKFKCCNIKKRLGLLKPCENIEKITENVATNLPRNKKLVISKDQKVKLKSSNSAIKYDESKPMQALKLDFNGNKIDDIINNFHTYFKKSALSAPKERKFTNRKLSRPAKHDQALHKLAKNTDIFKQCITKNKPSILNKIKDSFLLRIGACMVLDIVAIITLRKLGIVIIGHVKKLMGKPSKSILGISTVKNEVTETKRVDMFRILPFHRTKARVIKKTRKYDKVEKAAICMRGKLIDKSPKIDYASDYYMLMLSLKMKALNQNLKSKADVTSLRFGLKRYSVEFKQSLIQQLAGIYKSIVRNEKLRNDLVFCIMKIYECKFEYAPTFATYTTSEAFDRLDKFKTLLVDYYRHKDNPQLNTKYLKSTNAKQKEDLEHILELMLQDQKLGATRSNIECKITADNSTFKYEVPVHQCQSAFVQKPLGTTQSSSNMFKTGVSSVHAVNDPGYYMRERFSLLAKFWKLKQAYFTKRIQICNMLKDKLSESCIAEHEGANILDGIISNAITSSNVTHDTPKIILGKNVPDVEHPEALITTLVDTVYTAFDARRKKEVTKTDESPPLCKKICRVNNELYRELFEKKAQAIQEKDLSRGKLLLGSKTSDVNSIKLSLSKPYQVVRDPRFHNKL